MALKCFMKIGMQFIPPLQYNYELVDVIDDQIDQRTWSRKLNDEQLTEVL